MINIRRPQLRYGITTNVIFGIIGFIVWFAPIPELKTELLERTRPIVLPTLPADNVGPNMHELISRPLFVQTRRPPASVPIPQNTQTPPPKPAPTIKGMVLLGILQVGKKGVALVTLPGDAQPKEIMVGAALGDWVVKEILSDRLILKSGDVKAELVLPRPANLSTPVATLPGVPGIFPPLPSIP